ncbi:MAG: hypothetical protein RL148_2171 [Planctomycetota bacterium]|jgi:A/G-specific adenine glycosylase
MEPFSDRLLRWFDRVKRDLPWRHTRDPWAIWVSEVMLQQTRVEVVRAPFERFVARFPTPADFAAASDDVLQAAWRGLGYYRRARLLREGARAVVRDHGGRVPQALDALGELPGIGDYTLGAVGSIAFGHAVPALDGNVERVLSRHLALRENVRTAAARAKLRAAAASRLCAERPGDTNQALMELGATVCTPLNPRCTECPVAADCEGRKLGIAAELPVKPRPRAPVDVHAMAALARAGDCVFGRRIEEGSVNSGQVELPGAGLLETVDSAAELQQVVERRCGAVVRVGAKVAEVRHAITHHRITLVVHDAAMVDPGPLQALRTDDPSVPWTTAARKTFRAVGLPTA